MSDERRNALLQSLTAVGLSKPIGYLPRPSPWGQAVPKGRDLQGKPFKVRLDGSWFGISAEGNLIDAREEKPFPTLALVDARNGIADTVGHSAVGATALAWANPSTGGAGVIEQIDASNDGPDGCRGL